MSTINKIRKMFFNLNQFNKTHYLLTSSFLLLVSIICITISVLIYFSPTKSIDYEKIKKSSFYLCDNIAREYGFVVTQDMKNNKIGIVKTYISENPKSDFANAEIVYSRCPNFELSNLCLGKKEEKYGCDNDGLNMKLNYIKPNIVKK